MALIFEEHITELEKISLKENIDMNILKEEFERGSIVYIKNKKRDIEPLGIGKGLPTRVNVNLGTSDDMNSLDLELEKIKIAEKYGADTIMDLSTGGNIPEIRKKILNNTRLPLGTVPIYEIYLKAMSKYDCFYKMEIPEMLEVIEEQAKQGVDYMTIHAGLTLYTIKRLKREKRIMGIVSRGGSFLSNWMLMRNEENPFLQCFDDLLKILKKYNVVISIGDGLRPGCVFDATDHAQISELLKIGELKKRANDAGVQVIVEGPGHVPLSEIKANVMLEKKLCEGAPFYVLGPLPIDIAPGYDHITAAVGGSIAAAAGADFLCYVTPAEHLRLPDLDDVKEGLIASKIAAQIGDFEKGIKKSIDRNMMMDRARAEFDWKTQKEAALDSEKVSVYRDSVKLTDDDTCSMCGKHCAIKIFSRDD